MKKVNFLTLLMFISLSVSPVFAAKTAEKSTATSTESSLTKEEVATLSSRVIEIRDMDKSEMTSSEKSELKSELKEIKETMKSSDPYIYIGGSTLLILIIVLIVFL